MNSNQIALIKNNKTPLHNWQNSETLDLVFFVIILIQFKYFIQECGQIERLYLDEHIAQKIETQNACGILVGKFLKCSHLKTEEMRGSHVGATSSKHSDHCWDHCTLPIVAQAH
jgi:hypothetical protein